MGMENEQLQQEILDRLRESPSAAYTRGHLADIFYREGAIHYEPLDSFARRVSHCLSNLRDDRLIRLNDDRTWQAIYVPEAVSEEQIDFSNAQTRERLEADILSLLNESSETKFVVIQNLHRNEDLPWRNVFLSDFERACDNAFRRMSDQFFIRYAGSVWTITNSGQQHLRSVLARSERHKHQVVSQEARKSARQAALAYAQATGIREGIRVCLTRTWSEAEVSLFDWPEIAEEDAEHLLEQTLIVESIDDDGDVRVTDESDDEWIVPVLCLFPASLGAYRPRYVFQQLNSNHDACVDFMANEVSVGCQSFDIDTIRRFCQEFLQADEAYQLRHGD